MSYIDQFSYQITGPELGTKWVFLHGLMGYGANWKKITLPLEKDAENPSRILTYDQRGHGKSMKPLSGFSPEDFADDLFLITQDLGWEKFILVGHSMGGRNAMSFAHRFPHMVEKLIIEDIGPDGDIGAVEHFKSLLDLVPVPFVSRDEAKNFFMGEFLQKAEEQGRDNPNMLGQFFYANLKVDPDTGLVDWIFSKHAIIQSLIEGRVKPRWFDWENLNMPTLLVRGERSKDLSEDVFNEMLRRNRMAKGVVVPESGHWIHAEKPKEFLKVILEFKNNA